MAKYVFSILSDVGESLTITAYSRRRLLRALEGFDRVTVADTDYSNTGNATVATEEGR